MFDNENFHVFREGKTVKEKEKIIRTKLPRRARNFSKEQLQLALRKKKECNAKALKIVESLLEPVEDTDEFLLMLQDINQTHFDDVIQERAILFVCGYPLCQHELTKYVPSQKYVISLSNKKVYNITERKNFCSGECYKASNYIKEQMLTSPLWLRDQEDIPDFKLLDGTRSSKSSQGKIAGKIASSGTINVDGLQIVEKINTGKAKEGKNSNQSEGRINIREGSEVDLTVKEQETRTNEVSKTTPEELDFRLDNLSLKD